MEEETVNHDPLLSCFTTLYTLILLYFPLQFLLSPVLLLSVALIFSLLRLGSTRDSITRPVSVNLEEEPETKLDSLIGEFVEWDFRAPLEVIHEAYEDDDDEEEEEEEDSSVSGEKNPTRLSEIDRFPSLLLYYPESDSESESSSGSDFNFPVIGDDWISPEKMGLRWEEEEEEEDDGGLIEIKLEEYNGKINKWNQTEIDFHAEEEGLIEIDIFP